VDLDGFLERIASGDGFGRDSKRVGKSGSKQQPARCACKTQDKVAMAPMAKKFLHCCIIDREGLGGFELVFEPPTHLPVSLL